MARVGRCRGREHRGSRGPRPERPRPAGVVPPRGHPSQGPTRPTRDRHSARSHDPRRADLERETTGPISVPRADVEIDFDIEWDPDDHVYLWGALVNRAGEEPVYHPVVAWRELDDAGAIALAESFATGCGQIAAAAAAGQSLLVYHYAHPEPAYLKRLLGERGRGPACALRRSASDRPRALLRPLRTRDQEGRTGVRLQLARRGPRRPAVSAVVDGSARRGR